ncbi:MAG: hypothetical protein IT381_19230 [Deltaproteobacteria bacterium]|nr:hypothetical protein [Deltaproteobacteria bacterium]
MTNEIRQRPPPAATPATPSPRAPMAPAPARVGVVVLETPLAPLASAQPAASTPGTLPEAAGRTPTIASDEKAALLTIFAGLRQTFLGATADGPLSEAYTPAELDALASAPEPSERALAELAPGLAPAGRRALDKLLDGFWAKRLEGIAFGGEMMVSPTAALFNQPTGMALVKAAEPVLLSALQALPKSPGGQRQRSGDSGVEIVKLEGAFRSALKAMPAADIDELILIVMHLCAKDAEHDLREAISITERRTQQKQAMRELKREYDQAVAALKQEAQAALSQLKESGHVDPAVTLDEFLACCQVSYSEGKVSDAPPYTVSFSAPVLIVPDPIPASLAPQPEQTGGDPQNIFINPAVLELPTSPGGTRGFVNASATFGNDAPMAPTTYQGMHTSGTRGQRQTGTETGEGTTSGSFAAYAALAGKTEDAVDALADQSESDRLKMQMLLDRRQKAFEALSSIAKKTADTNSTIIKNFV